jgi:predicted nucleic acid-binding protein
MLLCDTGILLAAGNVKDQAHQACVGLLRHCLVELRGLEP